MEARASSIVVVHPGKMQVRVVPLPLVVIAVSFFCVRVDVVEAVGAEPTFSASSARTEYCPTPRKGAMWYYAVLQMVIFLPPEGWCFADLLPHGSSVWVLFSQDPTLDTELVTHAFTRKDFVATSSESCAFAF